MSESPSPVLDEAAHSPYGYVPTQWITITFIALFGATAALHAGQAIRYRVWWMFPTLVTCAITECIGWGGRYWSSNDPGLLDPFLMQICCTIIAPSFMTAASFTILGKIIPILGSQYSRLTPKIYLIVFLIADLIALVVQAVGGAQAATAAKSGRDADMGGRIMVGGIIFQMAAITVFVICATEFLLRYHYDKPVRSANHTQADTEKFGNPGRTRGILDRGVQLMVLGLIISTIFIYVRSVYRTIELLDGWNGSIISNQLLFNVLDGMPIVCACFTFNIFHPGFLLTNDPTYAVEVKGAESSLTMRGEARGVKEVDSIPSAT